MTSIGGFASWLPVIFIIFGVLYGITLLLLSKRIKKWIEGEKDD